MRQGDAMGARRGLAQCAAWRASGRAAGGVGQHRRPATCSTPGFPAWSPSCCAAERLPAELAAARDHRDQHHQGVRAGPRRRPAAARARACRSRSTTSAPGSRRWPISTASPSASSSWTAASSPRWPAGTASRDSDLVRATIDLGHALGLRVVAEGVEDAARSSCWRSSAVTSPRATGVGRPVRRAELARRARRAQPRSAPRSRTSPTSARRLAAPAPPPPPRAATVADRGPRSEQAAARRHHPQPVGRTPRPPSGRARGPARPRRRVIVRASSDHARATPPTRAVGPQPVAALSSAARA